MPDCLSISVCTLRTFLKEFVASLFRKFCVENPCHTWSPPVGEVSRSDSEDDRQTSIPANFSLIINKICSKI